MFSCSGNCWGLLEIDTEHSSSVHLWSPMVILDEWWTPSSCWMPGCKWQSPHYAYLKLLPGGDVVLCCDTELEILVRSFDQLCDAPWGLEVNESCPESCEESTQRHWQDLGKPCAGLHFPSWQLVSAAPWHWIGQWICMFQTSWDTLNVCFLHQFVQKLLLKTLGVTTRKTIFPSKFRRLI